MGLSSSLLIDARSVFPYLAVVTLSLLSKALLTYKGKHYFNPSNFGVVTVVLLGYGVVSGSGTLFAGSISTSWVFAGLGLLTVIYARQAEVSLSWLISFIVFALVRGVIERGNPWLKAELIFGTSLLLFTFHMISDPATVPQTRRFRILYGVFIALIDSILRHYQIFFSAFYALFLASCLMPWVRDLEEREAAQSVGR